LTGNIGRTCLVYGNDLLLNQRVAKLIPLEPQNRAFAYFTFRQDEMRAKLEQISNGVAQQNLSPIETGRMEFCVPSKLVLSRFSVACEPIINQLLVMYKRNINLRQTRDLLLPKLISGEVVV
jgi:type I restriction enzyme S subunit